VEVETADPWGSDDVRSDDEQGVNVEEKINTVISKQPGELGAANGVGRPCLQTERLSRFMHERTARGLLGRGREHSDDRRRLWERKERAERLYARSFLRDRNDAERPMRASAQPSGASIGVSRR
jgi:hypothetical protein